MSKIPRISLSQRSKAIAVEDFSEKHNVYFNTTYVFISKNRSMCKQFMFKDSSGQTYIFESFFTRRQEFKKKVWLENHKNYYFLSRAFGDHNLGELINTFYERTVPVWRQFLSRDMFKSLNNSIFNYKIADMQWEFFRISTFLIRKLFKIAGVKKEDRDLDTIWEHIKHGEGQRPKEYWEKLRLKNQGKRK